MAFLRHLIGACLAQGLRRAHSPGLLSPGQGRTLTLYQSLRIWFQPNARSTAKRKLLAESSAGAPRPVTSSSWARPLALRLAHADVR